MAYQFTFTSRFQKRYKALTEQEKKQLMKKLELLAENPNGKVFQKAGSLSLHSLCHREWQS